MTTRPLGQLLRKAKFYLTTRADSIAFYHSGKLDETGGRKTRLRRLAGEHAWSGRCAAATHRWSVRSCSIHWRSSIATHSPSTAPGVAIAQRASNRRQKHRSVCSGSPCRSRPARGQPRASDARPDASPPCEWRTRRRPAQLTPREAMARIRHKRGVFSVRPVFFQRGNLVHGANPRRVFFSSE